MGDVLTSAGVGKGVRMAWSRGGGVVPSGPAATRHELAMVDDPTERSVAVEAAISAGLAAGDAVVAFLRPATAEEVRRQFGPEPTLRVVPEAERPDQPAAALRHLLGAVRDARRRASEVRVVDERPPLDGALWGWRRYEAALDIVLEPGARVLCVHDGPSCSPQAAAMLAMTHPLGGRAGPGTPNPSYVDPGVVLSSAPEPPPLPCEARPPELLLIDPRPSQARRAVARMAGRAGMPEGTEQDLLVAVSEMVANADQHGRRPTTVAVWTDDGGLVVRVTDGGRGPTDLLAGMRPAGRERHGLGLWVAHQLVEVVHRRTPEGFAVVLRSPSRRASGSARQP